MPTRSNSEALLEHGHVPPGHRGSVLAPSPPEPYTSWPRGARDAYRQHGGVQSFFRHRLRSAGVSTRAQINVPNVGPSAHLLAPSCPSGRHRLWIGYGPVERGVPIVVALEQRRDILAFEDTAKPVTLSVREMANQAKQ